MSVAAELIERATVAGVTLRLVDGEVKVRGSRVAMAELIEPLRKVKEDVIRLLEEAAVPLEVLRTEYQMRLAPPQSTPAVPEIHCAKLSLTPVLATTAPEVYPNLETSPPATERPQPWHHVEGNWRPLAQAYHQHHTSCRTCQCAGQGRGLRCGTGAALWTRYSDSF